jgi:hypothetical protein
MKYPVSARSKNARTATGGLKQYSSYSINPQQQKITDNLKNQQSEEHYRPQK